MKLIHENPLETMLQKTTNLGIVVDEVPSLYEQVGEVELACGIFQALVGIDQVAHFRVQDGSQVGIRTLSKAFKLLNQVVTQAMDVFA